LIGFLLLTSRPTTACSQATFKVDFNWLQFVLSDPFFVAAVLILLGKVLYFRFRYSNGNQEPKFKIRPMRNVIYGMYISIDGTCDHTNFTPDEENYEYFTHQMHGVDLVAYGRKTYELMVPYWPDVAKAQSGTKAQNEFAQTLTGIDKIVFSRTLNSADGTTRIIRENPEEEIRKLKQQPGGKISIGGVSLRSQLMAAGLIDEYYFVIYPIIAGEGKRLLENIVLPDTIKLKLVDSKIFKSGCVGLHYVKQ
jgi:dihydrofolate reductase